MQAVQSAHVLAIRASLATEALRVGAVLDGQVLLVEDHIAVDIRHRHLGSRNQVEVVDLGMIHLALLVGQLAGAIARCSIHHRRRHNLGVPALASLVEEEVDECALQAGTLTDVDRESGTRDLHAQVEVDEVVFLCQLPVGQRILNAQRGIHCPVAHGVLRCALLQI